MSRTVYISCEYNERNLPPVDLLCQYLRAADCVIEFAPQYSPGFYREIEDRISQCDAFVAVMAAGRHGAVWLAHELQFACDLNRARFTPRPRLFGLRVDGIEEPGITCHISLEWLDGGEKCYQALLEDCRNRATTF